MSQNYIITHPDYNPKGITYGFIGTKIPVKNYCYKNHEYAEENRQKVLSEIGKEHLH